MKQSVYDQINSRRLSPWKNEEEVRIAWNKAIEIATGITLDAERGRKDASYNHVVIEYKAPGLFKGKKNSPSFKEAIFERLLPYIQKDSANTGIPQEDYIGIAIDGEHICFAQVINGQINAQELLTFSPESVEMVLDAIVTDTRKAFTIDNLLKDFGHGSEAGNQLLSELLSGLEHFLNQQGNNKVKMLFEEWRTLYGQVADMTKSQADALASELSFTASTVATDSVSSVLFVLHTYNSILIKLIACEIVAAHGIGSFKNPSQVMAVSGINDVYNFLDKSIEHSQFFKDAGIKGFVEEAIFSWYLELKNTPSSVQLSNCVKRVFALISLYRMDKLERTRDILRDLYQGLVPSKLRQSLGEFYTPDWLVDFTLSKIKLDVNSRYLDPTCGSGAFLLAVIREKRALASAQCLTDAETLEVLSKTVWGFDLNPLAVQTARVNFLIEIADLLARCKGFEIELPVLLADAIYSPARAPNSVEDIVEYKIGSQIAKLNIKLPAELALDRNLLDAVFERMGNSVQRNLEFDKCALELTKFSIISASKLQEWSQTLAYTYNQVLNLHRKNWNGIWFRIVRNFFWSATAGQFDYIVGNPPWVRWSKLPDLYRERVKPTCEHYGIFSNTKRHGGNELDISAMITYAVADKWLHIGGKLAFVITGTLFKNPSSAGFRTFKIEPKNAKSCYLQPKSVDDLKLLKPFEDATNHTTVAILEKTKAEIKYPVPYIIWSAKGDNSRVLKANSSLGLINSLVEHTENEAVPVGESGSPWAVLPPGRFEKVKYLASQCEWVKGRKGITTDLNGVYFVQILNANNGVVEIESRPEAGRKNIGSPRKAYVEPTQLYPLIKGAGDFEPYYIHPRKGDEQLYTFVPNSGINTADYEQAEIEIFSPTLKKTLSWFKHYESHLLDRSTYKRQMKGAPFHAVYNVGDYTFAPWKVIWPEMSKSFYAAVVGQHEVPFVGQRPFVPDHKVYFAAFNDAEKAYFLCGMLNSPTVIEWINSHNVSIQVADVFKHLNLPEYESTDDAHNLLIKLVEEAHQTNVKSDRKEIIKKAQLISEKILLNWSSLG